MCNGKHLGCCRRSKDSVEIKGRERQREVQRGKENENANGAFSVVKHGREREDELEQRLWRRQTDDEEEERERGSKWRPPPVALKGLFPSLTFLSKCVVYSSEKLWAGCLDCHTLPSVEAVRQGNEQWLLDFTHKILVNHCCLPCLAASILGSAR